MKLSLSLVLSLFLVACATEYTKPGSTPDELDRAIIDCRVKKGQAGVRDDWGQFMERCMRGEGWAAK